MRYQPVARAVHGLSFSSGGSFSWSCINVDRTSSMWLLMKEHLAKKRRIDIILNVFLHFENFTKTGPRPHLPATGYREIQRSIGAGRAERNCAP